MKCLTLYRVTFHEVVNENSAAICLVYDQIPSQDDGEQMSLGRETCYEVGMILPEITSE